jgi:CelD/BcsL family acetyltransferase involved in cellulose biosynthesis
VTADASTELMPVLAAEAAAAAIAGARRAARADRQVADRQVAPVLATEWRELAQLEPVAAEWRELAEAALESNVFYEPAFALAAAPVFAPDAGAVLVWSKTTPRRLLGFFPARIERRRYGIKLPVLVGLTHPYGPLGVPLVARDAAATVMAAWLAHLAGDATLPGYLLLPSLPVDGGFAAVLDAVLDRAHLPAADFNRRRRALLAPGGDRRRYIEQSVGAHRRKELRRLWRRLDETGAARLVTAAEPAAVAAALEDFFALESGGWKGRAGTAAAGRGDIAGFVRAALDGLAVDDKVSIDRLLVDGQAIAAAIALRSGRGAWFWKIAYDEAFARFSPGVLLTVVLTEQLVEQTSIAQADSCATENHPMIDRIWRERLTLCDRLVALRPRSRFAQVRQLEGLRATAMAGAKRLRSRLRRWHGP